MSRSSIGHTQAKGWALWRQADVGTEATLRFGKYEIRWTIGLVMTIVAATAFAIAIVRNIAKEERQKHQQAARMFLEEIEREQASEKSHTNPD